MRWLSNSVTIFYTYSHGDPDNFQWGGFDFWSGAYAPYSNVKNLVINLKVIGAQRASESNPFFFVWLDACNTAGANGPSDILGIGGKGLNPGEPLSYDWFNVFPLADFNNCFIGNNGRGLASSDLFYPAPWLDFRYSFWHYLWQGYGPNYSFVNSWPNPDGLLILPQDTTSDQMYFRFQIFGGVDGYSPLEY